MGRALSERKGELKKEESRLSFKGVFRDETEGGRVRRAHLKREERERKEVIRGQLTF